MKKLFITLCAMMAMCLAGFSVRAAVDVVYICGAINDQGWKPTTTEAIKLQNPENGWFKLNVTTVGQFKVSSTAGTEGDATDVQWDAFDKGVMKYDLATKALNAVYDGEKISKGNSTIPNGTKVFYVSSDMTKAAISDGTWTPDPYIEPTSFTVKVDVTIPGWTDVKCHYWGGNFEEGSTWPGLQMTNEGNNIWSITLPAAPDYVIFNNGNGHQSIDLAFKNGKTYVLRSTVEVPGKNPQWTEEEGDPEPDPEPLPDPTDEFYVMVNTTNAGWSSVNCHYWGGDTGDGTKWPGKAMTKRGNNIWYVAFDKAPANVIFNNGNGEQSVVLAFDNKHTYVLSYQDPSQSDHWVADKGIEPGPVTGLSNTLPVLYINIYMTNEDGSFKLDGNGNKILDNYQLQVEEIDKEYRPGEYWLDMNGCTTISGENIGSKEEPLPLEMKGRGNWTRKGFAKKPFKLKLGAKQVLLGMGKKSKHWAILAHADDNYGYMRNFVGFNLGHRIGLPWTPDQQPVEVVINGNYRGLYFLTESIRVGDGRVPIEELADNETSPALISGGYLVELDNYDETNQIQMSEKVCPTAHPQYVDKLRITWDTPEEYSDVQKQFVTEQFSTMNDYVGVANTTEGDNLWSYLDLDDAARYYVVMEICSHTESYHGSTYLFRDRGEGKKWHFSPLWDMGNAFNGPSDNYFYTSAPFGTTWMPSFLQNAKFMAKVKETWKWFMSQCYSSQPMAANSRSDASTSLFDDIDAYVDAISTAAKADRERWKDNPYPSIGAPVCDNSDMQSRKQAVKDNLNRKINWLKQQWGDYNNALYAEPERDTTPAADLPEYAKTGIEDIVDEATDAAPVYYNLQGLRVASPAAGNIYIEVRGNKSRKIAL